MKTTILKKDEDDERIYLRSAVTVAFFFPTPLHAFADRVRAAVELYFKTIPNGSLTWSVVGASADEWKPVTKTTFGRCLAQLDPIKAKARQLTSFELIDGSLGAEAPGYGILLVGSPGGDPELPDEANLLQLSFPAAAVEGDAIEDFVEFCRQVAALIPFVSGYASPGLHWAMLHRPEAMGEARPLAIRHPGYDVQYNLVGRLWLGRSVRGARWLTFLGEEITARLGGADKIREALSKGVAVEQIGAGLMLRAGTIPEVGDVNKQERLPLLREMAALLEPVTAFRELVLLGNFAERDETFFERWERRFLD